MRWLCWSRLTDLAQPQNFNYAEKCQERKLTANKLRHIDSETAKLFVIECVGARPGKNAGAELEENAPGFPVHAELLHKPENEAAQRQFPSRCASAIVIKRAT